ncbi:hypothetical protein DK926_18755 [Rhodococcus sp. Eu-32]|nr:hypothetical protein DK926_18755 [Rhodococcus sp. Eu-32]
MPCAYPAGHEGRHSGREHDHHVRITESGIEFFCTGDRISRCHQYPDCDCEAWDNDHEAEYGHPFVAHDECWMQAWFDNDCVCPSHDCLDEHEGEYKPGMWGPVTASFNEDYVEWEFIDPTRGAAS